MCFRPLAGLSCINHINPGCLLPWNITGFRPLAGLSCINHENLDCATRELPRMFPSPRGVELHKPLVPYVAICATSAPFPSLRGVELHKPLLLTERMYHEV